jgi:hypothetical protein
MTFNAKAATSWQFPRQLLDGNELTVREELTEWQGMGDWIDAAWDSPRILSSAVTSARSLPA